jgi:hypothetical protein
MRNITESWFSCDFTFSQSSMYKGSSKSFHTFIFSKKMERVGGVGEIVGCHVTSWQGKPVDLSVSVRVATKQ